MNNTVFSTRNSRFFLIAFVVCPFLLSGCATIFAGGVTKVTVKDGLPSHAKVFYKGNYEGRAPITVKAYKNDVARETANIEIKEEGYKSTTITLSKKILIGWLIADIPVPITLVIDFITGAIYGIKPKQITYSLEKK